MMRTAAVLMLVLQMLLVPATARAAAGCPAGADRLYDWLASLPGDRVAAWRSAAAAAEQCGVGEEFGMLADAKALAADQVATDPAALDGTWVSTNWYAFAQGVLVPFVDVVEIRDGRFEQRFWRFSFEMDSAVPDTVQDAYSFVRATGKVQAANGSLAFSDVVTETNLPKRLYLPQETMFEPIISAISARFGVVSEVRLNHDALMLVRTDGLINTYRRRDPEAVRRAHAAVIMMNVSGVVFWPCLLQGMSGGGGKLDYDGAGKPFAAAMDQTLKNMAFLAKSRQPGLNGDERSRLGKQAELGFQAARAIMSAQAVQSLIKAYLAYDTSAQPVCLDPP